MTKKTKKVAEKCAFADEHGVCGHGGNPRGGFTCKPCEAFVGAGGSEWDVPAQRPGLKTGGRGPRYVKTVLIATCLLEKHPDAAAFGAEVEDRTALASSVEEVGVLDPLSVVEDGERYLVLDGCGRLDALRAIGADEALCMVFDLMGMEPRDFAMQRNTMQRKVTTGQRLMCYLSVNKQAVVDAMEDEGGGDQRSLRSRDRSGFSSRSIAGRLGVSDKDVRAGVELLRCEVELGDGDENDAAIVALREVWNKVMRGDTPIRRWRPAWEGVLKTKHGERAPIDYSGLACRSLISLRTVFGSWQEIPLAGQVELLKVLGEVLAMAPEAAETVILEAGNALRAARVEKTRKRKQGE